MSVSCHFRLSRTEHDTVNTVDNTLNLNVTKTVFVSSVFLWKNIEDYMDVDMPLGNISTLNGNAGFGNEFIKRVIF